MLIILAFVYLWIHTQDGQLAITLPIGILQWPYIIDVNTRDIFLRTMEFSW